MKIIVSFFLFYFISINIFGQDTAIIPKGVVYKKASTEINNTAKKLLIKEINKSTATYSLFDKVLYIGPNLWQRYKNIEVIKNIQGGDIKINIPQYTNGRQTSSKQVDAKLIQNKNAYIIVWNQVMKDLADTKLKFRKLNTNEIKYYWSVIFFDIEEPVFIIENEYNYKYLIQLTKEKQKILWIDEIKD